MPHPGPDAAKKKKQNPNSNKQSKQKKHNEIPPHIQKKKRKITDADGDVEKTEHLCTAGGNANGAAAVDNSLVILPKVKDRITV